MNLDIIPNGAIKRVHVSQNDVGRTLTFELFNNSTSYTVPSGAVVKIQGTKPSGLGFSETCTVNGNVATIDTTEAMTDESGNIQTELSISYGDVVIGTSNFVLAVEKNPHPSNTTDGSMETIVPELTLLVNEVKGYAEEIEGTYHAYGSPWVASTVAEMTDTDKIYVYTGSETGYTNGNWYYYNGSAWVSGGVYNAVAVQTDTTLSVSGMPADAEVVGFLINNTAYPYTLNKSVSNTSPLTQNTENTWSSAIVPCSEGDVFMVKGYGGSITRLWMFSDSEGNVLTQSESALRINYYAKIVAPANASYLSVNSKYTSIEGSLVKGTFIRDELAHKLTAKNKTIKISASDYTTGVFQTSSFSCSNGNIHGATYLVKIPLTTGNTITIDLPALDGVVYHFRYGEYDANGDYLRQTADTTTNSLTAGASTKYVAFGLIAKDSSGNSLTTYNLIANMTGKADTVVTFIDEYVTDYIGEDEAQELIDEAILSITNPTDIVSLNKGILDELLQAKRPINLSSNGYLSETQPLVLLHFSDIHGDQTELQRIVEFRDKYASLIDDTICTGDMAELRYASDFTYWDNVDGADNILLAIGNHDALADPTGWDWSQKATQTEQYTKFFAQNITSWGCVYEVNKTYYYKDYVSKKIRLIVLNCILTSSDDSAQLTWFETVLDDAKTNEYNVVIANHYMIANSEKVACNFTTLDRPVSTSVLSTSYIDAVQSFVNDGGKFICYIAGHTHMDYIVRNITNTNQLCIVVDALNVKQGNQYSDTQRTIGTKSQDLANLIAFDTSSEVIKIMRVGANKDHYLRPKNCITINYNTGAIVTEY